MVPKRHQESADACPKVVPKGHQKSADTCPEVVPKGHQKNADACPKVVPKEHQKSAETCPEVVPKGHQNLAGGEAKRNHRSHGTQSQPRQGRRILLTLPRALRLKLRCRFRGMTCVLPRPVINSGMLRSARLRHESSVSDGFHLRGREVTRLEGFSDAVFGFALTLLVVSLDVPRTFSDLIKTMRGFPAFAVCFLLLAIVWNSHYKFCRRYGLDDGLTRFLTCILLFLVLFYVYPLKFLFNLSINGLVGGNVMGDVPITNNQLSLLLVIYGLGFAAVYGALLLLYLHAWRLREVLELSVLERLDSRFAIYRISMVVCVGLLAAWIAYMQWLRQWAGFIYFLLFPILRISRIIHRRKRALLLQATALR